MKRFAIYATYEKNGIIDDYIIFCLGELRKVVDDIFVVSNHILADDQRGKLSIATDIYEKDDTGYDVGGYAYVISQLRKKKKYEQYDEGVFLNDSIFGPFYPLNEMFQEMNRKTGIDFWGITERGESEFDGGESIYPRHIQLYFFVIKERMLKSSKFTQYFENIQNEITGFRSAILNYEFGFTKYFEKQGFKWDIYCRNDSYINSNPAYNLSPYHYYIYDLLKNMRCPFFKRKLFNGDFIEDRYTDKLDISLMIKYIKESTRYDTGMIWDYVLRNYRIDEIMNAMQLYTVIKCADINDINVTRHFKTIDRYGTFKTDTDNSNPEYIVFLNLSRDTVPYALFVAERNNLFYNLLEDGKYEKSIVDLFNDNPKLGLIIPPMMTSGKVSKSFSGKWVDQNMAENLINTENFNIPTSVDHAPIYKINGFICRKQILTDNIRKGLEGDNSEIYMQAMPLYAQQEGYYTEVAINEEYVHSYITNLQRSIEKISALGLSYLKQNDDIEEMCDEVYGRQISDFMKNVRQVYIYGAGQLACRVVKIIESQFFATIRVVVSDCNGNSNSILGHEVRTFGDDNYENERFIIAVGKKNTRDIENKLKSKGITKYIVIE